MLQVVGVGRCCGVELFGGLYGAKTDFDLTKTGRIMNRQNCSNCTYKLIILSTNQDQCWERACAVFSYMRDRFEKHKKKYLRISPKY